MGEGTAEEEEEDALSHTHRDLMPSCILSRCRPLRPPPPRRKCSRTALRASAARRAARRRPPPRSSSSRCRRLCDARSPTQLMRRLLRRRRQGCGARPPTLSVAGPAPALSRHLSTPSHFVVSHPPAALLFLCVRIPTFHGNAIAISHLQQNKKRVPVAIRSTARPLAQPLPRPRWRQRRRWLTCRQQRRRRRRWPPAA